MAVVDVLARIKADSSGFTSGINDAQRSLNKFSTSAVTKGTIIGNVLFQAGQKAAQGFGVLLKKAFQESVQGAREQQAVQERLRRLLLNTNGATEEQVKILHQHAKALEATTVVTASNITMVQSQLATFDLHGSTIAQLTPAILDYVVAEKGATASADQFKGMANSLAAALDGQFGALSRVGFRLTDYQKQMIKTGTESERAQAIVDILGTTYKDFASINGAAASAQIKLSKAIEQVKGDFGDALLPVINSVTSTVADKLIPILQDLQARFGSTEAIQGFIALGKTLAKDIGDFGKAIKTVVAPVITGLLMPAIKATAGAFIGLIKVLGAIGRFIQQNANAFKILFGVLVAVKIATIAYRIQVLILNKTMGIFALATGKVSKAFKGLNLIMMMNPIGFIIGAVAALVAGFVLLWNNSESFRKMVIQIAQTALPVFANILRAIGPIGEAMLKVVTGPMRLLLKALSYLPGEFGDKAAKGLELFNKGLDSVAEFADTAADKIDAFAATVSKYENKKIKAPSFAKAGPEMPDLSLLGSPTGGARVDEKEAKKLAKLGEQLRKAKLLIKSRVEEYNDFLINDFSKSMLKGGESARDSVLKALDMSRSVFDAQAKILSGPALDNLEKAWNKVNKRVRGMIEGYAEVADQIKEVEDQIKEAYNSLEDAIEERQKAVSDFQKILAYPFGEPSELERALGASTATVDSIISMYDTLREKITQRYTGISAEGRDTLLGFLETQTAQLIGLSKRRAKAVEALLQVEESLRDVLEEQANFAQDIRSSLKSFATAITDLSETDAQATVRVIKTSTGLVLTQIRASGNGIDRITNQLRDRLKTIVSFNSNIQKLLASGLDRTYIKALLEAGPEAAGATALALASASSSQISEINNLYSSINSEATSFGDEMSKVFYDNAVDLSRAFVAGAKAELESIDSQMLTIKQSIEERLKPLSIFGSNLGTDLAQGLYDALLAQKDRLVSLAENIASAISKALASAMSSVGISGAATLAPSGTSSKNLREQADELRQRADELRGRLTGQSGTSAPSVVGSLGSDFRDDFTTRNMTTGARNGGNVQANVTINTTSVSPTVTAATVANAIQRSTLTRRAAI